MSRKRSKRFYRPFARVSDRERYIVQVDVDSWMLTETLRGHARCKKPRTLHALKIWANTLDRQPLKLQVDPRFCYPRTKRTRLETHIFGRINHGL